MWLMEHKEPFLMGDVGRGYNRTGSHADKQGVVFIPCSSYGTPVAQVGMVRAGVV